jgi:hypothetical protein
LVTNARWRIFGPEAAEPAGALDEDFPHPSINANSRIATPPSAIDLAIPVSSQTCHRLIEKNTDTL